jgi:ubiquinone/menaquinone biosynthesis C-methylase UbiE
MSEPTAAEHESQECARQFFDRWARFYGSDPFSRSIRRAQRQALTTLALSESDRLLDIGCGPGMAVIEAAPLVAHATGLDLSPAMIARARSLADDIGNVEFVEGDSAQLPFADGAFSAVLSTTSLHHYPHPDRALAEMRRVLAPSGRIAIGDLTSDRLVMRGVDAFCRRYEKGHVHFYRTDELTALLESAGFRGVTARSLLVGGYALVTARSPGTGDTGSKNGAR